VKFIFLGLFESKIGVPVPFGVLHQDGMPDYVCQVDEIFAYGSFGLWSWVSSLLGSF
jgi:hypothetical protein